MSQARWTPNKVQAGWSDQEPDDRLAQLETELAGLKSANRRQATKHQLLYDTVQEFVKDATELDLGNEPNEGATENVSKKPLRRLQIFIWEFKRAFATIAHVSDTAENEASR